MTVANPPAQPLDEYDRRDRLVGSAMVLASAAAFGAMPVLAKFAYDSGADILSLLAVRFLLGSAIIWPCILYRGQRIPRGRVLAAIAATGSILYVGQSLTYFSAIRFGDVSIIATVGYTYPIFVLVIAMIGRREQLRLKSLIALGGASVGVPLLLQPVGDAQTVGIVLAAAAAIIYAVYLHVSERVIPRGYAAGASAVIITSAGIVFTLLALPGPSFHLPGTPGGWLALAGLAVGCTAFGILALLTGLQKIKPITTATIGAAEPLISVVLAFAFLNEDMTVIQIVGLVLVLVSVVLAARVSYVAVEATRAKVAR